MAQLNEVVLEKVAVVGELLIRAAAAIGILSKDDQLALDQATNGELRKHLALCLGVAAKNSTEVASSLRSHPPVGFALTVGDDTEPSAPGSQTLETVARVIKNATTLRTFDGYTFHRDGETWTDGDLTYDSLQDLLAAIEGEVEVVSCAGDADKSTDTPERQKG